MQPTLAFVLAFATLGLGQSSKPIVFPDGLKILDTGGPRGGFHALRHVDYNVTGPTTGALPKGCSDAYKWGTIQPGTKDYMCKAAEILVYDINWSDVSFALLHLRIETESMAVSHPDPRLSLPGFSNHSSHVCRSPWVCQRCR